MIFIQVSYVVILYVFLCCLISSPMFLMSPVSVCSVETAEDKRIIALDDVPKRLAGGVFICV